MGRKRKGIIHPHLCKACIEMLKEDNPYLYHIEPVEVPLKQCDNYTVSTPTGTDFPNLDAANKRFDDELAAQGIKIRQ